MKKIEAGELEQRLSRRTSSFFQVDSRLYLKPEAMIAEEYERVGLAETVAFAEVRKEPNHGFYVRD